MNKIKKYIVTTVMALTMVLPIIQPLAVHAEETESNSVAISGSYTDSKNDETRQYSMTLSAKEGYEIIGYFCDCINMTYGETCKTIDIRMVKDGNFVKLKENCDVYNLTYLQIKDGKTTDMASQGYTPTMYYTYFSWGSCRISWSGFKMFETFDQAKAYVATGSTDGLVEPPKTGLDKEWYLKNIGYSVRAEDGGENEDATFIKFTWDTNNLQDGDLIEIRTHNWYRTLTGSQYSGFHDYITFENGVSAVNGSYEISQYEATNAWFKSLDNTPLVFKSFDTDTYYLRPYRNGVYGGWVRISMKRNPAIKGTPYVNNVEYGDFDEETGDFVIDNDRTKTEGGYGITQKGEPVLPDEYDGLNNVGTVITTAGDALKYFFSNITSVMGLFGQLPQLLNAVIGWLPSPLIVLICASVVVVIILRIFGR